MTSINSLFGNNFNLSPVSSTNAVSPQSSDSDGDSDGSTSTGRTGRGGFFASAVTQALSQLGISAVPATSASSSTDASASSTTTDGSTTSSTQDPQKALGVFMHDLFAALRGDSTSQSSGSSSTGGADSDGDNDGSSAASGASGHHQHHGGASAIESKLQTLIQQLSAASNPSSSNSSSTGTAATSGGTSADATLQTDFQNLLNALGASGNQTSLPSFLTAISNNLQSGSNPGLNVSLKA